ncbi:MAG TPA: hypothetical protein VMZ50_12850 [Phycisphaerae bacterium]|nr:hypothetical protein [Phycisphaerae bacterium]
MTWEPDEYDARPMAVRTWHILSRWAGDHPDHEAALLAARRLRDEGVPVASVEIEVVGVSGEMVATLLDGTEVRFPGHGVPDGGPAIAEPGFSDVPVLGCEDCEELGEACPEHRDE